MDDASFFFLTYATCPTHLILASLITQYLVRSTVHECPLYTIFIILILLLIVSNIPRTIFIYALPKTGSMKAVWLRHLAASLMVWRPKFNPRSAKVGFVVDTVQWHRLFFEPFSIPISTIP
jgi:hypothetical protein